MIYWADKKTTKKKEKKEEEEPAMPSVIFMGGPSSEDSKNPLEIQDNRIYYYGPIEEQEMLHLNKAISRLDKELQIFKVKYEMDSPPIHIHINSYGGSIFAALAVVDCIRECKTPVHTHVDGCAASAATLITVAGDKRIMSPNSFMLIHQLSSGVWGNYEEMKEQMQNHDLIMDKMKEIYKTYTKIPDKKLKEILKHDLWFDSEQCLEYGLVDKVI